MPGTTLLARFRRFVEEMETLPAGPGTVLLVLGGIIAVRNLLEVMVANNPAFKGLSALVHYPLAYLAPFLALTLVLAFWSRVAPNRVARLMVLAWLLTLVPPVADLALHHRTEAPTIGYLVADPADLGRIFRDFFNPWAAFGGTTPGIRIEAAAAVLLGGVYVALRGRSWLRTAGAMASIYITCLFFFALPILTLAFFRLVNPKTTRADLLWGQGAVFRPDPDTSPDSTAILWLIPVLLGLFFAWRKLERRDPEEAWFSGSWGSSAASGFLPGLALALLAGLVTASMIRIPPDAPQAQAPLDTLAPLGGMLALLLAGSAVLHRHGAAPAQAGLALAAAVCLAAALGRTAAMGLAAAAGPLVFLGTVWLPPRFRFLAAIPIGAIATLGAWAAGFALVVGPEGFARLPQAAIWFALAGGGGLGILTLAGWNAPPFWGALVAALTTGTATWAMGGPALGAVGTVAGAVAGFFGRWADRQSPRRSGIWTGLLMGTAILILGRGAVTAPEIREALKKESLHNPRLEVIRAEQYEKEGNWDTARTLYREALKYSPDYLPALRGLGLGLVKHDPPRLAMGIEMMEKAARHPQALPTDLSNLASVYIQKDRAAEALPLLERARSGDPFNTDILFNRAAALEALGEKEAARQAWGEYIGRARRFPELAGEVQQARKRLKAL